MSLSHFSRQGHLPSNITGLFEDLKGPGEGGGATEIEGKGFDCMVARIWRGAGILSPPRSFDGPTVIHTYLDLLTNL